MSAQSAEVPSYRWLIGMSTWILLTAIPQSVTAWLGFLLIAIIARRAAWGVIGVIAGALALLAHLPIWGQFQPIVVLLVYLAGMLGALWLNPAWLRTMWERREANAAAQGKTAASRAPAASRPAKSRSVKSQPVKSQPEPRGQAKKRTVTKRDLKRASAKAAVLAEPVPEHIADQLGASTAGLLADPSPENAPAPVDINEITAAQFAKLPGFTRSRGQSAVRRRNRDGRYVSIDDFAARMRLQPHELVRLRDHLVCSPPLRGPRSFGRRVDY